MPRETGKKVIENAAGASAGGVVVSAETDDQSLRAPGNQLKRIPTI
jgi:hypothetical protein